MKEIVISKNSSGQRLNKYLERLLCNAGSGFLYKMLRKKNITLNGEKAQGSELLKNGDVIRIYFSEETFEKFSARQEADYPPLETDRIVYEDGDILIYNKPAGLLSQKTAETDLSACEYLLGYLKRKGEWDPEKEEYRPSAVNRLDRNTTGLLLCAKNLTAARELSKMLKDRTLQKDYLCIVRGRVTDAGDLRGVWVKDASTNTVSIGPASHPGKIAETSYTPVRFCAKLNGTLLRVRLHTGKTHQIRAQLAAAGMPLAGDSRYGDADWNAELKRKFRIRHQLLHAWRVIFPEDTGTLASLSGKEYSAEPPFQELIED